MKDDYEFEWDKAKSASNAAKHGLDFEAATAIWDDPFILESPIYGSDEGRRLAVGRIGKGLYLTAIFVYRGEKVRIISARRSSKKEVDLYAGD